ncbi:sugar ABC transporter ATP-binding protein [Clostridium lacusfryxellense]|uniref:sugar ABC transporter ATP-binding protein n=1 Tax=Clostridium lacusfryxellense TaxID=205328 RepID=UPI001C0D8AFD|nr:sugar ABC transporter ATP-binding protein [Clostridium lacusfryxellense]MBU3112730.1 sugar ABC transporter ATP-binding protein [Clostridium lacusfryxellense]
MSGYIIEMCGISKQFNDVSVLKDINFNVKPGEVHTLFGENGSGKSVLMKILSGVLQPDSGLIYFNGENVNFKSYNDAQISGIRSVFQDHLTFPDLTVAENLFLFNIAGESKIAGRIIKTDKMYYDCQKIFKDLNFNLNPKRLVKELDLWEKQLLEIAKAISVKSQVIIMDEPTNLFSNIDIENIYKIIENLKQKKISIVFISHRVEEVLRISDRITIMRDGQIVTTGTPEELTKNMLIKLSAGNDLKDRYPKLTVQKGRVLFKAENLSVSNIINNINFAIKKGEVLGIAGLVGSGRTTIAKAIFGICELTNGQMFLNGTKLNIKSPRDAIKAGIGFVSEDRLAEGLIQNFDIASNITLTNLNKAKEGFFLRKEKEKNIARRYIKKLVIKTPFIEQIVKNLSGGNQQKVVLSKWLFSGAKVFIFDEPTAGLDSGSKVEVYNIMNEIVLNNGAIILISSDFSELMGMSDRILGIYNGQEVLDIKREQFDLEKILYCITGEKNEIDNKN